MHTVKPLDEAAVVNAVKDTGAPVIPEEHLHHGALGSVVAQLVCQKCPAPIESVDIGDRFAESGDPDGLLQKYGLTPEAVAAAVKKVIARKK